MHPDFVFLLGLVTFGLSVPATINGFSTAGSTMRVPAVCILVGGTLVAVAMTTQPGGYGFDDISRITLNLFR